MKHLLALRRQPRGRPRPRRAPREGEPVTRSYAQTSTGGATTVTNGPAPRSSRHETVKSCCA